MMKCRYVKPPAYLNKMMHAVTTLLAIEVYIVVYLHIIASSYNK